MGSVAAPRWTNYILVGGCALGIGVNFVGIFAATFSVFIKPISSALGWTRSEIIFGYSAAIVALALALWPVGMLVDRYSPRLVILLGVPIFGIAVASLGFLANSYPLYLLLCALIGGAGACSFHIVYLTLLSRSFDGRFGLALGFAVAGSGLGVALLPSYAQALINYLDWRTAYIILGLTSVAIAWPNAWLLRERTANSPSVPSVMKSPRPETRSDYKMHLRRALRSVLLWRIAISYFLVTAMLTGHVVNLIALLTDRGMAAQRAAAIVGLYGVALAIGRLGTGYLLDRTDPGKLGAKLFLVASCGAAVIYLPAASSPVLIAAVFLLGLAGGAEGDLATYVVRKHFPSSVLATLNGGVYIAVLAGTLTGPIIFAAVFDHTGSYAVAQLIVIGLGFLSAIFHWGATGSRRARPMSSLTNSINGRLKFREG